MMLNRDRIRTFAQLLALVALSVLAGMVWARYVSPPTPLRFTERSAVQQIFHGSGLGNSPSTEKSATFGVPRNALPESTGSAPSTSSFSQLNPPRSSGEFASWVRLDPTAALAWLYGPNRPAYASEDGFVAGILEEIASRRSPEEWARRVQWSGMASDALPLARAWSGDPKAFLATLKEDDASANKLWVAASANPTSDWLDTLEVLGEASVAPTDKAALLEAVAAKVVRSGQAPMAVALLAQKDNPVFDPTQAFFAASFAGTNPEVANLAWKSLHSDGARYLALVQILGNPDASPEAKAMAETWRAGSNLTLSGL